MMKLAIEINPSEKKWLSNLISIFSRGRAFHVEPVFSDGYAFIATPDFVGLTTRNKGYDKYHWILIDCPWISKEEEEQHQAWAKDISFKKAKYDFLGAISGFFGSKREDPTKWYCGEICAKVFGKDIPELNNVAWATPDIVWKLVAEKAKYY